MSLASFLYQQYGRGLMLLPLLLILAGPTSARDATQEYQNGTISYRKIDKSSWEKAKGKLDFNEKRPEYKEKELKEVLPDAPKEPLVKNGKKLFSIIAYSVVIILLAFIAIRIYTGSFLIPNKKIKKQRAFTIEEAEENIHESDLERLLRETLANKSYKVAIRLYYLMIIKELSLGNVIQWSKEKTNREYVREMRSHASFTNFRELTRTFERVWYGDYNLKKADFMDLGPRFEQYIQQLRG